MAMLIDRRYNPFRDFEDIDRSFFGDNSLAEFKTDIRDIGDAYVMECDLPGFRKEDIALNLHDKVLTIKAERHSDFENAEKKGSYLRCERSFGSYTRSFDLTGVDAVLHRMYHSATVPEPATAFAHRCKEAGVPCLFVTPKPAAAYVTAAHLPGVWTSTPPESAFAKLLLTNGQDFDTMTLQVNGNR